MKEFINRQTSLQILQSTDVNPVHYSVWTALQKMVSRNETSDTDLLKRVLIDRLTRLSLGTLNQAINQLTKVMMVKVKEPMPNFIWTNSVCTAATFITWSS